MGEDRKGRIRELLGSAIRRGGAAGGGSESKPIVVIVHVSLGQRGPKKNLL